MITLDMTFEDTRVFADFDHKINKYRCLSLDARTGKEFRFKLCSKGVRAMTSLMILGDDDPNLANHYNVLKPLLDVIPIECRMVP